MKFRQEINNKANCAEEDWIDDRQEYIEMSIVREILDDIELKVNEIKDYLEPFVALSEIKDIHELAKRLSRELY